MPASDEKTENKPSPDIRRVASNIQTLGIRCRLSQRKIGDAVGLSQAMVSRWTNGTSTPDAIQAAQLARLFAVPMEVLVSQDVSAIPDRELEKIRDVMKAIEMLGYEETHRRLLIAEPRVGKGGTIVAREEDSPRKKPTKKSR